MSQMQIQPALSSLAYDAEYAEPGSVYDPRAGVRAPVLAFVVFCIGFLSVVGESSQVAMQLKLNIVSQVLVGLTGITVLSAVAFSGSPVLFPKEFALFVLFFAWGLVGLPLAMSGYLARIGLITLAKLLLMGLVVMNAVNGRRAYQWFLVAMILAAVLAAMGGITGLARGGEVIRTSAGKVHLRFDGIFGNANGMAKMACFSFWAALSLALSTRHRLWKLVMVGLIVFSVVVVGWTGSRQSIVGLGVMVVVIYWFVLRRLSRGTGRKLAWALVVAVGAVGLAIYMSQTEYWYRMQAMANLFTGRRTDHSTVARIAFFKSSLEVALRNPVFGVGYDCANLVVGGSEVKSPHNTVLALAANVGLVGWSLFYGAWLAMIWRMRRVSRLPLPRADRALLLCHWPLHAVIGVWMFASELAPFKPFWACMGAMMGYTLWLERTYGGTSTPPPVTYPVTPGAYPTV